MLSTRRCRTSNVSAVTQPGVRASDADRQRVVADLERHTAEGRLSLDEFSERVGRVYTATTQADLTRITHDLPAAAPPAPLPRRDQRSLFIAMSLALITIFALGVVLAIFKH